MRDPEERLSAEIARREAFLPGPLRLLSNQPQARRAIAIVLLVSVPLWLYAIAAGTLALEVNLSPNIGEASRYVAGRLLLFPLLFGAYLLAVRLPARHHGVWRFWALQITISAAFLSLMYPLLLQLNSWAFSIPESVQPNVLAALLRGDFRAALEPFRLLTLWISTSLELSEIYLLGLALIFALDAFLRYRAEQSLAAELHSKWLEAQLTALREQIGPHFLFNALNTILAAIRDEPEVAERMTIELGTLLRHNLDRSGQEFATVDDEMRFIGRYLEIMKLRFEPRLDVSIKLDPGIGLCRIPAFLLLPLVENAIKHGVGRSPGMNSIEISARREDGQLSFRVMNRAEGTPESRTPVDHRAIGLENTRSRIENLYGSQGSLSAGFESSGSWASTVVIPTERSG